MMPALEALRMIRTQPFVAAQFDVGSAALVVVRKYIDLALDGGEEITARNDSKPARRGTRKMGLHR